MQKPSVQPLLPRKGSNNKLPVWHVMVVVREALPVTGVGEEGKSVLSSQLNAMTIKLLKNKMY